MEKAEILEMITALRAMGARRCVVAGIEVDFAPQPAPVDAAPRLSPEAAKQAAREDDEALIYAACG
jgi:hypothetical protein